jgi:hypothetical protein
MPGGILRAGKKTGFFSAVSWNELEGQSEIEAIISHPEFADVSRSSGLPVAFGHLMDGRFVIVVYSWVDQATVQPITAYEVPE